MTSSLEAFRLELENKAIDVIEHKCKRNTRDQKCNTCVLGVLLSENGKIIEQYMLSWLTKKYNVFSIRQPLPGTLYEYPALRFAQLLSIEREEPILYLHTKGAANPRKYQRRTINMWMHEFVEVKAEYEKNINQYDLLLPYSGTQNITWLNGFIGSPKAFSSIPSIPVFENRYYYEILFKGSNLRCFGRRIKDLLRTDDFDNVPQMYNDIKRFSASFSLLTNRLHNLFLFVHNPDTLLRR